MVKKCVLYFILFVVSVPLSGFGQNNAIDSLIVRPLSSKVNANTLYKITFVSPVMVPTDAQFILRFPDQFDLSQLNLAGSSKIDGGFLLIKKGQQIVVKRRGEGNIIDPGKALDLLLSVVKNPGKKSTDYQLQFQILNNQGVFLTDS
ncbi:MAG TPA: hypothetical protein ENH29_05355, partial [Bacteroidetes bacterium]|nr:hypothetical protein [Bacteroidota bacterium]